MHDYFRKGQWFTVTKGPDFSTKLAKPETDLTVDMLTSYVLSLTEILPISDNQK